MRVLYVLDSLAPGGTECSTVVTAPALRELGVDAAIATLRHAEPNLVHEARARNIWVRAIRSRSTLGKVRELRRLISTGGFDLVHTALFVADQVGRMAAWGTGVPVVSSLVNTPYDPVRLTDPNVDRWKLRGVQVIDAITTRLMVARLHSVSEGAKLANAASLRIPLDRITVAERGRDARDLGVRTEERRRTTRRELGIGDQQQIVLNLGRQEFQKAQTLLVEAAGLLAERYPHVVLVIAGKRGAATTELERAVAISRADDRIRLLGHRTDVGDLLCAADVLAISSRFEGTAGAAIEAMALSTPVVSTAVAGVTGILDDGRTAVLVPPGDAEAIAAGISSVLGDPGFAGELAAQGRAEYDARFTLDAAARRFVRLYEDVVGARR